MTVPAAKVRAICSESELALVRASRRPELGKLSRAEVKRLAVRARKLHDKWQGTQRSQSRSRGRETGEATTARNTQVKAQIFREALDNFEAQLAHFETAPAASAKSVRTTKKARAAEHRASRAAVRKRTTAARDRLNE